MKQTKAKIKVEKRIEYNKRNIKNEKAISLIALVVTIIVLLILAGVSIATLTGENGILTRANDAKTNTEQAEESELRKLTQAEAATNLKNYLYTDKNEDTVTIPAGFAVSQVKGENTIENGLVIIDKNGNEFVWVPVSQENFDTQFKRKNGYYNNNIQIDSSDIGYGEANENGINVNINGEATGVSESDITIHEVQEMYESVYKNEGFYIGRYETGKDINGNAVIQKGASIYNNVSWSKNNTMNEESIIEGTENNPDGAIELARNFDIANEYTTVTTTLCYGVQWDATLTWIDPEYDDFAKNSTGMGWYNGVSGNLNHQTGIDLDGGMNIKKGIYDLAGNVYEWTMESRSSNFRVLRGRLF